MTWRTASRAVSTAGLLAALLAACAQPAPRGTGAAPAEPPAGAAAEGARLVVLVVIDQLPSWAMDRYSAALAPDGLFRRGERRGVWIERVSFPYAGTYTAPGHAAITTGKPPRETGVATNERWDRARAREVPWVDDGRHGVFGHPDAYASPEVLRVDSVGDVLRQATGGRAHVVSLSLKDRAAVLMGGHRPDIAVWYDTTLHAFTTSSYYAQAVPDWLARFREQHPVDRLLVPWTPTVPTATLERLVGRDDGPGEADWLGLGTVFPHDPRAASKPYSAIRALPPLNDDLLALADAAIEEYQLGADDATDFLAISVSTVDYAGHAFGPESWEYLEALVSVDRALGAWLDRLERRTSVAVLATADHGVMPMPESSAGERGGRIDSVALEAELESALTAKLGPGPWIDTYEPPFVYLSARAEASPDQRARALAAATAYLGRRAGIGWAGPVDRVVIDRPIGDVAGAALQGAIELSIPPGVEGDLYVVPAPLHTVVEEEPRDRGTSHGSPWKQDTEVPVLFYGPGIAARGKVGGTLGQERVAATLAALLGIGARWSGPEPLPGN